MTDENFEELKQLILDLKEDLKEDIHNLDTEMKVGFAEVKGELKRIEEKSDQKLGGYEKRLKNAEFVSHTTVTAVFIGFVGGLAKLFFFSN